MLNLKLIPNWRHAWKMLSMQISALGAAAVAAWGLLPQEFKEQIPADYVRWSAGLSFGFIMLGRMIDQPATKPEDEAPK